MLRREADALQGETYELRKECDYQAGRNLDMGAEARDMEIRLKDKDDQLYAMRKDLDNQKFSNSQMRDSNIEMLNEKDALEKHAAVL